MKKIFLTSFVVMLTVGCSSVADKKRNMCIEERYYPYVYEIHNSSIIYNRDNTDPYNVGIMYRAVIIKQDLYEGLIIESLRVADEGVLTIERSDFIKFDTESTDIEFESWVTPKIVRIKNEGKIFEIEVNESVEIKALQTDEVKQEGMNSSSKCTT